MSPDEQSELSHNQTASKQIEAKEEETEEGNEKDEEEKILSKSMEGSRNSFSAKGKTEVKEEEEINLTNEKSRLKEPERKEESMCFLIQSGVWIIWN